MLRLLTVAGVMFSASAVALDVNDFSYVEGASTDNYSLKGKPNATYNIADQLPSDILQNVYSMLPEGSAVNPDFIDASKSTSIAIDSDLPEGSYAEVTVTFLNEGAGYRNSLGYFIFDTNNPPATKDDVDQHVIIFPNASKPAEGEMLEGDTLDLNIQLLPGQSIGFFVIPNGWGWWGSYNNLYSLGSWGTPFYSLTDLNPESDSVNRRHNVTFIDLQNEFLVVGFEDLYRPDGDNDFNDLLFTVNVSPFVAVDGVNPDGSTNANYEILTQKNATDITVTNIYPSANSWATLAFEDRWPVQGDYDFNDLVLHYRITETMDGQRNVKALSAKYSVEAMGGDYHNGFALRLPNVPASAVAEATLTHNGLAVDYEFLEESNGELVIVVSNDTRGDLEREQLIYSGCRFYRTQKNCLAEQLGNLEYQLDITFATPIPKADIGLAPFDPYIFATPGFYHGDEVGFQPGKSWETHLKNHTGTANMDYNFFGLFADASTASTFFITNNNFPWAVNLTYPWVHPLENVDISNAYPDFANWVKTSGEANTNWYLMDNARINKIATQ